MKIYKVHKSLRGAALVGAAALAVIGCSREVEMEIPGEVGNGAMAVQDGSEGNVRTVHFRAVQAETRAQFGEKEGDAYPTLWTENDTKVKLSLNYGGALTADVTPSEDYRSATFSAEVTFPEADDYTFYSISPASAAQSLSQNREAWKVSIPCIQTPTATSVDEAGIIIAATSETFASETQVSEVALTFQHLTAYGRMSMSNLDLHEGETVSSVEITTTTPIVGDWFWKTSGASIEDYGASSTLTINTTGTSDIWFACAPVDVSDEVLNLTVYTNLGCFEQMVLFPENRQFEAGKVAVFTVDMEGASFTSLNSMTGEFSLVTDASTLTVGDEIIITDADANAGMYDTHSLTYVSDPNKTVTVWTSTAVSAIGPIIKKGDARILTLCAGSNSNTWALNAGTGYLAADSEKDYELKPIAEITAASSWTISITNGEATILTEGGGNKVICTVSVNSKIHFCSYSSEYNLGKVAIYRRPASAGGTAPDAMLSHTQYGCYLGTDDLTWEMTPGTDQATRYYSTENDLTYSLINPSDVEELTISGYNKKLLKGEYALVDVSWRKGTTTKHTGSYVMKVIKEEGPKVWLSDGAGKGFIIKK